MSSFNYNHDLVKVKRLPFIDKTNLLYKENLMATTVDHKLSKKSSVESFATLNPKLSSKVRLRSCGFKKENHSSNPNLQSLQACLKQSIANDQKFMLIPKVHLQRLNIEDKMKIKTNTKRKNITSDPKYYQKLVVEVDKCNELEAAIKKSNMKSQEVRKKVQFTNDTNLTPKFDKALRKRRTKNYAEISFKDTPSPTLSLEQSYKEHVPVYLQSTILEQKQKEKDPFEFISDSLSDGENKKRGKGRPRKVIRSPLQYEKRRRGRSRKGDASDSDSNLYDKSMHEVLKKIKLIASPKKIKYVKRKNAKQNNKVKIITNQIENGQLQIGSSKNIKNKNFIAETGRNKNGLESSKIKIKAGPNRTQKQTVTESRKQNINEIFNKNANGLVSNGVPLTDIRNATLKSPPRQEKKENSSEKISSISTQNIEAAKKKKEYSEKYFGFDEDFEEDFNDISIVQPTEPELGRTTLNNIKPVTISQRFTSLTSTPLPNMQRHSTKLSENPKGINIISNVLISPLSKSRNVQKQLDVLKLAKSTRKETSTINTSCAATLIENDDGEVLGFENSIMGPSTSAGVTSKNSFIDSNICRQTFTESDFHDSVSINNRSSNVNASKRQSSNRATCPWRGDRLQIRRNPHFLTIKDTSLPCYNQEMILQPKLLERPKTFRTPSNTSKNAKVQKSILEFVNSNKVHNESTPTKKNHNMTLFDDADFSPIRNNTRENSSRNKNSEDVEKLQTPKSKRNIFGVHRKKNRASPLKERNKEEDFGIENYFGFDSPCDKHLRGKENVRVIKNRAKNGNKLKEEALPMRVPINKLKKIRDEVVEELLDEINLEHVEKEPIVDEIVEELSPNEKSQEENLPTVGLFEDLAEVKQPRRIYERKRTKRTRAVSVSSDTQEEVEKPKGKRKNILTWAEEQEFNKWASKFNAMCNEIEKHDLTVD